MRPVLAFCVTLLALSSIASADNPRSRASQTPETAGRTEVVTDQAAHVVRVLIDGREILTVTPHGIVVNGDVTYSGIITDIGPKGAR